MLDDIERFRRLKKLGKISKLALFPRYYLPYLLYKTGLVSRRRRAKLFFGKDIAVDAGDTTGYSLYFFGSLIEKGETKLTKFLLNNLGPEDVFYDVGANYGFYTHLALEVCKEVHAFEPAPGLFRMMQGDLSGRANVFLNAAALSDRDGKGQLHLSESSSEGTILDAAPRRGVRGDSIEVQILKLDTYLAGKNKPTFIKMDVEGAEKLVIDGGRKFFSANTPVISMEVQALAAAMPAVTALRDLGYRSYLIDAAGKLETADADLSKIVEQSGERFDNFIFKK